MIASWMVYVVLVTLLLALAGVALEPALHRWGVPLRWGWMSALAASVALPLAGWLIPRERAEGSIAGIGDLTLVGGSAGAPQVQAPAAFMSPAQLDGILLAGWAAASLVVLGMFVAAAIRLRRDRMQWKPTEMDGREVFISDSTGPAVLGLRRMTIVLPEWTLTLPEDRRQLLVRHEDEHIATRDPYLLVLAAIPLLVIPWALPVWWQHRRLRAAIEIDCDRRVLAGRPAEARSYGDLLIAVGAMLGARPSPFGSLAAGATQLERRIRMIANPWKFSPGTVAGFGGLAALLLAGACTLQPPMRAAAVDGGGLVGGGGAARGASPAIRSAAETLPVPVAVAAQGETTAPVAVLSETAPTVPAAEAPPAPSVPEAPPADEVGDLRSIAADTIPEFTPYEVRPELVNRAVLGQAIERSYPMMLKDAGIGGRVVMWVFIDATGEVGDTQLVQSSGHAALDEAALEVMYVARFSPAMNGGEPVPVWIQLPVTFATRA